MYPSRRPHSFSLHHTLLQHCRLGSQSLFASFQSLFCGSILHHAHSAQITCTKRSEENQYCLPQHLHLSRKNLQHILHIIKMYSKLSVAFVAALAVGAQAWGGHDTHAHLHKNGTYSQPSQTHESASGLRGGPYSHPVPGSPSEVPTSAAPSIPLTTGTSGQESGSSGSGSGSGESGDTTLTYTLGSGTSTTIITTTIHRTETNVNVSNYPCSHLKFNS